MKRFSFITLLWLFSFTAPHSIVSDKTAQYDEIKLGTILTDPDGEHYDSTTCRHFPNRLDELLTMKEIRVAQIVKDNYDDPIDERVSVFVTKELYVRDSARINAFCKDVGVEK